MFINEWLMRGVSLVLFGLGLIFSWWLLLVAGMLCAALTGRWIVGILLGLCADLIFGVPQGALHVSVYPFTLLALIICVLRALSIRHIREPDLY
jgi:hypothetical protein